MTNPIEKAKAAKKASHTLSKTSTEKKDLALAEIAKSLDEKRDQILKANQLDLADSKGKISDALHKRLALDDKKIDCIIESVKAVAKLEDPCGKTLSAMLLADGLNLYKVSVPIGVLGIIFESRPNVVVDVGILCLKSGNCVLMKGGSEAKRTNRILFDIMDEASQRVGMVSGWIQLIESRDDVNELLALDEYISLLIPRGSNEFVRYIKENTKIPVLGHAAGLCHVYIDSLAAMEHALNIAVDSKCQYPAVCNAMETLLVAKDISKKFLETAGKRYKDLKVEIRADEEAKKILTWAKTATDEDWDTEYNDMILSIKVVKNVYEAVDWINTYGSGHTDSIVTEDRENAKYFIDSVDSSSVMWNASTRFSDGFRYGLGAEVGISTNKIHARGPVGLDGLMIYKWVLTGKGHTVDEFKNKKFQHKKMEKKHFWGQFP